MTDPNVPVESRIRQVYLKLGLSCRVNEETHRAACLEAQKQGLNVSDWLRKIITREVQLAKEAPSSGPEPMLPLSPPGLELLPKEKVTGE